MILLKNATLIDGISNEPRRHQDIEINGNKISKIYSTATSQLNAYESNDSVLDCTGLTVMPGLIDAHVHLIYRGVSNPYSIELEKSIEEATSDALLTARELLSYGITTIRDVGTRGSISVVVRNYVDEGMFPGPKIYASSRIISTKGGLADFHPSHIFEHSSYRYGLGELILGMDQARSVVRRMIKDGVDFIKAECSGTGFNSLCPAERNTLSFEEINAIVDEAKQNGMYVACHAESNESVKKASRAGVRSVEHGIYLDDEAIELMLTNRVFFVPTLAMYWGFIEKGPEMGIPQAIIDGHLRTHDIHVKSIQKAMKAGACIVAGSDAGLVHFPQGGVRDEVCRFVEIGMQPMDALKTATVNAAHCLGIADSTGTLEEGKLADVIILKENPLDNISCLKNVDNITAVIKNGQIVSGDGLNI